MTDSGGIQEEAPSLNIPAIVMRSETERTEGIKAGCTKLAGTNKEKIIKVFEEIVGNSRLYNEMASVSNPYGDGLASERILRLIEVI